MRKLLFLLTGVALAAVCEGQEGVNNSPYMRLPSFNQRNTMVEKAPKYLFKVVSMEDWEKTCKTVHLCSMDSSFIHLSTEEQLSRIIEKFWADATQYIVLKLETQRLPGDLVLEANPGGTNKYYHLYNGTIPLTAIIEMKVYER